MAKQRFILFDSDTRENNASSDDDRGPAENRGHSKSHEQEHDTPVVFDKIDAAVYLHADNFANGGFSEQFVWRVTGLENGGVHVDLPGLGSRFGMYFIVDATGASGVFTTLNVALMVDPGNNNGALSSTSSGVAFANGTPGDFALAHGTLVSAQLSPPDGAGTRHANFVESLTLTEAGEEAFGGSLHDGGLLQELLATPLAAFQQIKLAPPSPLPNTVLVNGGSASIQLAAGGPMTLALDNMGHHGG